MAKKPATKKPEPRIAEGAGAASASRDTSRAAVVELAMSDAIAKAIADGVSDPAEQRKRMMAAREEALKG